MNTIFLWALLGGVIGAQAPAPVTPSINEKEFQEIVEVLRNQYADPHIVQDKNLNRTALQTLLSKPDSGIALGMEPSPTPAKPRLMQSELLPHKIGYWRLPSFHPRKEWEFLEKQCEGWKKNDVIGLVLDVRDFEAVHDYVGAAHAASYFTPSGTPLFTVQGLRVPQQVYQNKRPTPLWQRPLVVLVNSRTRGAAEAFAAILQRRGGAIIVGSSTAGDAALYVETKLNSGRYLRLTSAHVALGDGTKLFGRPVQPDIGLYVDERAEREALVQIAQGSAVPGTRELSARKRLSEAALVREDNPEIDAAYERQVQKEQGEEEQKSFPATQDVALIRCMDVLRGIALMMR